MERVGFFPLFTALFLFLQHAPALAQADYSSHAPRGAVRGIILDAETQSPIAGAGVEIEGTRMGASTAEDGSFNIRDVPVGTYVFRISYTGYEPLLVPDVVVKSGRSTPLDVKLKLMVYEVEGITVEAGYFVQAEEQTNSTVSFSQEEIRRAPGTGGDVSRIVTSLSSIARVNDQENKLIVRGGHPTENGFYIDNMQIPVISHFAEQGSTGGAIGILNVDFIKNLTFSAGGFSAEYGDRLSSVMDLSYREGDRENFSIQAELQSAGYGLLGEGPVAGGKGSWLFSFRKSYLDLLTEAINMGDVVPRYGDYQGKITLDISEKSKVSFLGLAANSSIKDEDKRYSEKEETSVYFFGLNWLYRPSRRGYSKTSVSYSLNDYDVLERWVATDKLEFKNNSSDRALQFRNVNFLRLSPSHRIKFGLEAKHLMNSYDYYDAYYTDLTRDFTIKKNIDAELLGSFVSYILNPILNLETSLGVRLDYFSYNERSHLSPRFSFTYRFNDRTSLNGSAGIYRQTIPLNVLVRQERNRNLKDVFAYHYILGINHLLSDNTRLTLEVYDKEYRDFPVDPTAPLFFVTDGGREPEMLISGGRAYCRGVELVLQKKLARDFYGLVSGTCYQSKYRDYYGTWRNRIHNNRYIFNLQGGYIANRKWEFSARFTYAGGRPYTPFDIARSIEEKYGIRDLSRVNMAYYPAYLSLNLRMDRRFNFRNSNLVLFVDIWNVTNRENIAWYEWSNSARRSMAETQWGLMPIFGLEWEF